MQRALEHRLRLRIDQLLADRDRAREQNDLLRAKLKRAQNRLYDCRRDKDAWRKRAMRQ